VFKGKRVRDALHQVATQLAMVNNCSFWPSSSGTNPFSVGAIPLGWQVGQVFEGSQVWWALAAEEILLVDGPWVVDELKDTALCSLADLI
jgi:hypothetical protein